MSSLVEGIGLVLIGQIIQIVIKHYADRRQIKLLESISANTTKKGYYDL